MPSTRWQGTTNEMGFRPTAAPTARDALGLPMWPAMPEFWITLLNYIGLYAIVALGLVLLTGVGGLTSFGQASFVGFGAYVTAWLTTVHGVSPWLTLPAGLARVVAERQEEERRGRRIGEVRRRSGLLGRAQLSHSREAARISHNPAPKPPARGRDSTGVAARASGAPAAFVVEADPMLRPA